MYGERFQTRGSLEIKWATSSGIVMGTAINKIVKHCGECGWVLSDIMFSLGIKYQVDFEVSC